MEKRTTRFREFDKMMTIYSGFYQDDYEMPYFTTSKKEIEDFEYTASITAPRRTWVQFM